MQKLILLLALVVGLGGCIPQTSYNTTYFPPEPVWFDTNGTSGFWVSVIEKGSKDVKLVNIVTKKAYSEKIRRECELKFLTKKQTERELKKAIGIVAVEVKSFSIDKVSYSEAFHILIKDSKGNIKSRGVGPKKLADHSGSEWYNYIGCELPENIEDHFFIYVIDTIQNTRTAYEITKLKKTL